ncbi:MAG: hypothetical protein AB7E80_05365 [Hyphomicrobiaceae bacterium]
MTTSNTLAHAIGAPLRAGIGALLALAIVAGLSVPADARGRRLADHYSDGYVVAHSRHGNGSISAPVRDTRMGPQVRLPGGTWEYCRRSCSETLRVETVDIWEGRSDGRAGLAQECGVFGCLELRFGW